MKRYQNFITELSSVAPQDSDLPILVMVGDDVGRVSRSN